MVLDLFCGEGGASKGYEAAGLSLLAGVDNTPARARRHYAWDRGVIRVADWQAGLERFADQADLIHASPPCQAFSTQTPETSRAKWTNLIPDVRAALKETGKPYVIENVQLAPLMNPVEFNGLMFPELRADWNVEETAEDYFTKIAEHARLVDGVWKWDSCRNGQWENVVLHPPTRWRIHRTRLFETYGFTLTPPPEQSGDGREVMSVTTSSNPTMVWNKLNRHGVPLSVRQEIMGGTEIGPLTWMTGVGVGESIPPAFAREVGCQFLRSLGVKPRVRATVEQVVAAGGVRVHEKWLQEEMTAA